MFDHDYERSSSDDDVDRNDYKQDDAQEEDEDAYLESTGKTQVAMITESLMITNTDLYSFAEEFMELIENQTFLWPVPMLKVIKFLSDKSIEFSKEDVPGRNTGLLNYQQLYNEVNLVMVMLLLNVPVQLDIEVGDKLIDLNKTRQISYKKQPFHEPLIILEILLNHKKLDRSEIRPEILPLLFQS